MANYSSIANKTKSYLLGLLPENFNVSKIEKFMALFENEELFSEYQRRFQLQFTANRTYYEEIMRNISAELKMRVRDALETKVKPYIRDEVRPYIHSRVQPYMERLQEEMERRSRPFFASDVAIPEIPDHREFLDGLTEALDLEGAKRMMGKAKQTMCGMVNKVSSAVSMVKRAMRPKTWIPPYRGTYNMPFTICLRNHS